MPDQTPDEEFRAVLTGEHPGLVKFRNALKRAPHDPRCKLCAAPFAGVGGAVLRHMGFGRFPGNPALCQNCIKSFRQNGLSGAEIPVTLLFADVRGSTGIAEAYATDRIPRLSRPLLPDRVGGHPRPDGLVDKLSAMR